MLRACVENEAGPPGSSTKEQVRKGERESDAHARMDKKHTGKQPVGAEDTSGARDGEKRTRVCILMNKSKLIRWLQPIRPAEQMPMLVRLRTQGIRWRYNRKHMGVPRSGTSLPKACRKESYGEWTEEKRSVLVRQHFVLPNARCPFPHRLLFFYSSRREPFSSLILYLPNITT